MTLKELTTELARIDDELLALRRADYDIPGDVAFVGALRQHLVTSITEIRRAIDDIIQSLDHLDDVDRIIKVSDNRKGLLGRIQKALTGGEAE